jgi:antitoxin MazE
MQLKIIHIGNSKGIRLPQALIRQYRLEEYVTVELHTDGIMLRPSDGVRAGWEERFQGSTGSEKALATPWNALSNRFDEEEWTW